MAKCLRCSNELIHGELVCGKCGFIIDDRSSTANLNNEARLTLTRKRTGREDATIGRGVVLHIRGLQRRIELSALNNLVVGRSDPVNSVYPDLDLAPYGAEQRGVSRQHARLHYADGQLMVTDLESANGTRLNGEKLEPNVMYRVKDGDELTFGQLACGISYIL